jgi:hypothetical protein
MYEILPDGIEKMKEIDKSGFQEDSFGKKTKDAIFELIDQIINEINESVEFDKKRDVVLKLGKIKEKLNLF